MRSLLQIIAHALARLLLHLFYGISVPRRVSDMPCLIVANHNTHLDVFALFCLVPLRQVPRLHAVAAADYFGKGIMGWFARLVFNVVLVERRLASRHQSPLQAVLDVAAKGDSLIVFPEGSRGEPGELRPFKSGVGELAMHFPDMPIYPVALIGIERTMPRHRPLPIPFNITVRLCDPLRIGEMDLPENSHAARNLIAGELHRRIEQALSPSERDVAKVKAVSFDGDMTLWDFDKVMRRALIFTLAELRRRQPGPATEQLTIDRMIEIRDETAKDLHGITVNLEEIRLQAFRRTLAAIGQPDNVLAEELNALYLAHRFEDIELYPDVQPTLDALAPHVRLGLLSNGNGYPDRCGLKGRFQFVLFSQELCVEKPDPRMFLAACQEAGCESHELLHVGDSLECDVAGANNAGAISVWLNREGRENKTDIRPDFQITSLDELPGLLRASRETPDRE